MFVPVRSWFRCCSLLCYDLFCVLISFFDFFWRLICSQSDVRCSVICISLNLLNVRAVEMFVWLLGLVVHLSMLVEGGSSVFDFRDFFSILQRPRESSPLILSFLSAFDTFVASGVREPSNHHSVSLQDWFSHPNFRTWIKHFIAI